MTDLASAPAKSLAPAAAIFSPRFISAKSGARLRVGVFPAADDGAHVCVLLNGQTEFIEKYFEVIDELRARGFCVVTMDWRGQGGSIRALTDPMKVHVSDFSEYDDDLASLLDQVVAPLANRPPIGLAHSMGGHILLRTLHAKPRAFARTVLSAPMIAISTRGTPSWIARAAAATMNARGISPNWVWGMDKRDPLAMRFEDQIVTSDRARFRRAQDVLARTPEIRVSGPTWGWLEAAYRSMRTIGARGYAEAISTPTLIFGAGRDRICLTPPARAFAARMPHGKFIEIEDAEHEILMENDSIRSRFWKAFDDFVSE
jgi:lysophospholipase